jgi:hypothetical protein
LVVNTLIALTVFFGSLAYFRFYTGSFVPDLVFAYLLLLDLWLFSLVTVWGWFQQTDDYRFAFGLILVTVIQLALSRMFQREYENIGSGKLSIQSILNKFTS